MIFIICTVYKELEAHIIFRKFSYQNLINTCKANLERSYGLNCIYALKCQDFLQNQSSSCFDGDVLVSHNCPVLAS